MFKKNKTKKTTTTKKKWPDAVGVEPQTIYGQDKRVIDCASANNVKDNL